MGIRTRGFTSTVAAMLLVALVAGCGKPDSHPDGGGPGNVGRDGGPGDGGPGDGGPGSDVSLPGPPLD